MNNSNPDQTFLSGANSTFIRELHQKWVKNPKSVPSVWLDWFEEIGHQIVDEAPSWTTNKTKVIGAVDIEKSVKAVAKGVAGKGDISAKDLRSATTDSLRAIMLIRAF